jgi:hypothetical protein
MDLLAFVLAFGATKGNFIVTDMDKTGAGQWEKWSGDWGLPFVWTSLHVFGGNMAFAANQIKSPPEILIEQVWILDYPCLCSQFQQQTVERSLWLLWQGIKGNLSEINAIPFEAPPLAPTRPGYDPKTQVRLLIHDALPIRQS